MIVIGIDPGETTGIAFINTETLHFEVMEAETGLEIKERLEDIYSVYPRECNTGQFYIAVEEPAFGRNIVIPAFYEGYTFAIIDMIMPEALSVKHHPAKKRNYEVFSKSIIPRGKKSSHCIDALSHAIAYMKEVNKDAYTKFISKSN